MLDFLVMTDHCFETQCLQILPLGNLLKALHRTRRYTSLELGNLASAWQLLAGSCSVDLRKVN